MQGDHNFFSNLGPLLTFRNMLKGIWAVAWAAVLLVLWQSETLLGTDLFGGPVWFIVIGVRGKSGNAPRWLVDAHACLNHSQLSAF